ncbi:MAG: ECF transporter S component [Methanobacteriales archaeon HGW-Methanobacteriales-1]|jgi:energy-coupling factor transport system substrate-specific component|nr:MAG: ECF transporter S component [Methanobacteriales archaeon HGW-Methanobacteriales-1]
MDYLTLSIWIIFILLIIGGIIGFFRIFENSNPRVENLVLIAILVAISVMGTLPTAAIPGLQLASFIIIMTGIIFGRETGFITGVLTALVIGLFLGLGYWTIFQMIAWGIMGLSAGILSSKLENAYIRIVFGFMWGFFYGWITDISMLPFISTLNITAILGVFAASIPFDLVHGLTNAILLALFYGLFKRIFTRAKDKFILSDLKESSVK